MSESEYLSIKETMRALGVSRQTVYNLIKAGRLRTWRNPIYKRGPVNIPRADVEALLAEVKDSQPR
jgi:excisionase family DNA binding protein